MREIQIFLVRADGLLVRGVSSGCERLSPQLALILPHHDACSTNERVNDARPLPDSAGAGILRVTPPMTRTLVSLPLSSPIDQASRPCCDSWAPAPPPPYYSLAYPASRCIDGDLETYCHGPQRHENPWLSITLADRRPVDRVEVYNRADCCYSRISPYEVWVGDAIGSAEGW